MRVDAVEFYSGIGGMHYALRGKFPPIFIHLTLLSFTKSFVPEACPGSRVLAAFDINTTANMVYAFNFPETPLCQNNIQVCSIQQE